VISLDFFGDTYKHPMRILVAVEPKMYREAIAHVIRTNRPDDDVRLADSDSLDREASSFNPHLVVCTDGAPEVRGVSVLSWIVIRYHDSLSASVFLDDQDPSLIQDMAVDDLIWVINETQILVS
jgi:DNA-binding NarL/FixJ family response regulator